MTQIGTSTGSSSARAVPSWPDILRSPREQQIGQTHLKKSKRRQHEQLMAADRLAAIEEVRRDQRRGGQVIERHEKRPECPRSRRIDTTTVA